MRIVITYGQRPPYPPFGRHLAQAFRDLSHPSWLVCVRDRPWWGSVLKRLGRKRIHRQWDQKTWAHAKLHQALLRYRPDGVLDIGGDLFESTALREMSRRFGNRFAVWLIEGPYRDAHLPLAEYAAVASSSRATVRELCTQGLSSARYLPFATEPRWFRPAAWQPDYRSHRVGFVGAGSRRRAAFFERISDFGLSIWGTEWHGLGVERLAPTIRSYRGVFGKKVVRCYQRSHIQLSVHREHMFHEALSSHPVATGLNFRHFDVPSCGTLLLSEWVEELPEAFVSGKEMDTFTSPDELREKIRYYLSHESSWQKLVQAARARVLKDHTCHHRAREWIRMFGSK